MNSFGSVEVHTHDNGGFVKYRFTHLIMMERTLGVQCCCSLFKNLLDDVVSLRTNSHVQTAMLCIWSLDFT